MLRRIGTKLDIGGISFKMMLSIIVTIFTVGNIVGWISYNYAKKELIEAGKLDLMHIAQNGLSLVTALQGAVASGKMTLEEAQEIAKTTMLGPLDKEKGTRPWDGSSFVYKKNGYMFAYRSDSVNVMHPKNVEGTELLNKDKTGPLEDASGKPLIPALINASKQKLAKYHFYEYPWANPDEKTAREKLAYLVYFPDWDWALGVGAYTEEFYENLESLKTTIIVAVAINAILASLLFYFAIRNYLHELKLIRKVMEKVALGELNVGTIEVRSKSDIAKLAHSFNFMISRLLHLIKQIRDTSRVLDASSSQLALLTGEATETAKTFLITFDRINERSLGSLHALKASRDSVSDISAGMFRIAEATNLVAELSQKSVVSAQEGHITLRTAVDQMESIRSLNTSLATAISQLTYRSRQIHEIISLVADIARGINILSLNASIESAKAGQYGKGFAVIASEIQLLAARSKEAASQVSEIIGLIQDDIQVTDGLMNTSSEEVDKGTRMMSEAGMSFRAIYGDTEEISRELMELSATAEQISANIQLVNESIHNVASTAEQTAAGAEQASISSNEQLKVIHEISQSAAYLNEMSHRLLQSINEFRFYS